AVLSNQTVTATEVFQAEISITAGPNFTVANGGDATFQAGSMIVLKDGFSVATGGSFTAEIVPGICQ
ncbi:MAG: 3-coathanger stack domain-containing protein, partial [Thermoanaerobaculia bacterium]